MTRLHLSPPDLGARERALLLDAFDSNWVAPLGPHVDGFEAEVAARAGVAAAAALSSGTAALHLALLQLGVGPGDEVLLPTLTFAASANAVAYTGARPTFLDAEAATWNLDPDLLVEVLAERAGAGRLPAAVMSVDLYGQCADYDRITAACDRYDVPLIEDAAEALGATWQGRPAGSFGRCAAFSFNGNKIITTGGGGMLVSDDVDLVARTRFLATQAREPAAHYEHRELGYNYRLCNLNAAVGRGQLAGLDAKIARRGALRARYRRALGDRAGVGFAPTDPRGTSNHWLTVMTLDQAAGAPAPDALRRHLESFDIESRPAWKPMHQQPLYRDAIHVGGAVADRVFAQGLCLPSGSQMTDADQERVLDAVRSFAWPG